MVFRLSFDARGLSLVCFCLHSVRYSKGNLARNRCGLSLDAVARFASLKFRLREPVGLQKLPHLDAKHLGDSLNRFQPDAVPPAGFDVLKVPRPQAGLFGRRLLAPATREADSADIGA